MTQPVAIPFPLSTAPGIRPQESAGRIINGCVEPLGDTAFASRIYRRAPGLKTSGTSTRAGYRGAIEVAGTLYAAFDSKLVSWPSTGGAATNVGDLTGTRKGFFARNNAVTPDKW